MSSSEKKELMGKVATVSFSFFFYMWKIYQNLQTIFSLKSMLETSTFK